MLLPLGIGGISIDDKEALLANMIDQSPHLLPVIVSFYQPQIEHGRRRRWYDIASQRADVAAAYAINVKRRLID